MKILAKIDKTSDKYVLLHLIDKAMHRKINRLIDKGKYPQALLEAISKGEFLEQVSELGKGRVKADLILTEKSAHWYTGGVGK